MKTEATVTGTSARWIECEITETGAECCRAGGCGTASCQKNTKHRNFKIAYPEYQNVQAGDRIEITTSRFQAVLAFFRLFVVPGIIAVPVWLGIQKVLPNRSEPVRAAVVVAVVIITSWILNIGKKSRAVAIRILQCPNDSRPEDKRKFF